MMTLPEQAAHRSLWSGDLSPQRKPVLSAGGRQPAKGDSCLLLLAAPTYHLERLHALTLVYGPWLVIPSTISPLL